MGVRSGSSYRILDADGNEHWVNDQPVRSRPPSRVGWFGKMIIMLFVLMAGVGSLAMVLPSHQSGGLVDTNAYVARTLSVPSTVPPTTKASGPAAIACRALGYQ